MITIQNDVTEVKFYLSVIGDSMLRKIRSDNVTER